jgi:hypothetical protein
MNDVDEFSIEDEELEDDLALEEAEAVAEEEMIRLQLLVQEREQIKQKNEERRSVLADKKREIELLKLKLAGIPLSSSNPGATLFQPVVFTHSPRGNELTIHASMNQTSSNRALDFGTPYTSAGADMYGRAISRPLKRPSRRQTLAVVDQVDDEDVISIRVPIPEKFDGSGLLVSSNDPAESVQVRLALSLDSIVDYIEYSCDVKGVVLSERQFVKVASRFLSGTAAGVYKDLKAIAQQEAGRRGDEVPALVTWSQLRKALELRFGRPQPGHLLIRSMFKLKQKSNESVENYTVRFDSLHMELTRQNLATRDLSIALYLEGLLPALQERVEEIVNSVDYCAGENIGEHEARKAIMALQRLAAARESHVNNSFRQASQAKPAQTHVSQPQQASNLSKQNSNRSAPGGGHAGPRQVNVPDSLYAQRVAAGLCGKCNSEDHTSKDCKRVRNLDPVPKRLGTRVNMMAAEDQCTGNTGSTQAAEQKN